MPSVLSRLRLPVRLLVVGLAALALVSSWPAPAEASAGRLSGVVRDNTGAVQAGARVVLVDSAGAEAGSDTTGSGGRFSVDVATGRYDVAVVTETPVQRIARVRAVDVAADSVLDVVVLPPFVTMSGTVRDRSGAPVGAGGRVLFGDQYRVDTSAHIDNDGRYSLRTRPGTYPLSIEVNSGSMYLYANIKTFTLTDDRVQDLTFAVTPLTVEAVDDQQRPVELAAVGAHSPQACNHECPAGFEFFPGAGEATGVWRAFANGATVLTLPGDIDVSASPIDAGLASVGRRFDSPWASPLRVVTPDAPAPTPPPVTVTWTGVVRHNGHPVPEVSITTTSPDDHYADAETDRDGRFELQVVPGHHTLRLTAYIGSARADDSGGPPPALHLEVADFQITAARTMDINIPTEPFAVTVLYPGDHPAGQVPANGTSRTSSLDIFSGGRATGSVGNYVRTDAEGKATFEMFPGSPPANVDAWEDGWSGSATVAPSDRSVTVRLHQIETATLSGTVRDPRGPLPLVNQPWVSFSGQAWEGDNFYGSHIDAAGRYALDAVPGRYTLTISDLPEHEYLEADDHVSTATLPQLWSITTTEVDLTTSKTLDLTIPDAAPARFRTVNADGVPFASVYSISSEHTVDLGPKTGHARAETAGASPDGRFEHMVFGAGSATGGVRGTATDPNFLFNLRVAPGNDLVLAIASRYTGGAIMPPAPTPPSPTTTTTTTPPPTAEPDPNAGSASNPATSGYWALASDGTVYNFGDAPQLGNSPAGAVDLEPTPSGKGYWTLNRTGRVSAFGDAKPLGNVEVASLGKGEEPASLSATPTGQGYWVFTNRGRAIAFGDAAHLGDMSQVKLNGPVLGSIATPSGKGYYMVASDGGIFAFGDAKFAGSMGGKRLNAPVQSLVPDSDGTGYWLVASDGGIFAFDATFRGSMGGTPLNKPVVGMVRYGDGYLMVGGDGGIFSFSTAPFAGSLGDRPPASPVVAVAALPSI